MKVEHFSYLNMVRDETKQNEVALVDTSSPRPIDTLHGTDSSTINPLPEGAVPSIESKERHIQHDERENHRKVEEIDDLTVEKIIEGAVDAANHDANDKIFKERIYFEYLKELGYI